MSDYIITKEGRPVSKRVSFACGYCGCEFSFSRDFLAPLSNVLGGAAYRCTCPNCGTWSLSNGEEEE